MEMLSTGLQVTEIALNNVVYNSLFVNTAVISLTTIGVVTYVDSKITYFQPFSKQLYFLSQFVANLEELAIKYQDLSSNEAPLIPTVVESS